MTQENVVLTPQKFDGILKFLKENTEFYRKLFAEKDFSDSLEGELHIWAMPKIFLTDHQNSLFYTKLMELIKIQGSKYDDWMNILSVYYTQNDLSSRNSMISQFLVKNPAFLSYYHDYKDQLSLAQNKIIKDKKFVKLLSPITEEKKPHKTPVVDDKNVTLEQVESIKIIFCRKYFNAKSFVDSVSVSGSLEQLKPTLEKLTAPENKPGILHRIYSWFKSFVTDKTDQCKVWDNAVKTMDVCKALSTKRNLFLKTIFAQPHSEIQNKNISVSQKVTQKSVKKNYKSEGQAQINSFFSGDRKNNLKVETRDYSSTIFDAPVNRR